MWMQLAPNGVSTINIPVGETFVLTFTGNPRFQPVHFWAEPVNQGGNVEVTFYTELVGDANGLSVSYIINLINRSAGPTSVEVYYETLDPLPVRAKTQCQPVARATKTHHVSAVVSAK